jgi:hypothetical protein
MYSSVRLYKVSPGAGVEIARRINEEFLDIVSKAPGFICYYVIDAGNDELASISVFKDQAGTEESNRIASDWVKQNIASLFPGPPEIVAGEVVAHTENT